MRTIIFAFLLFSCTSPVRHQDLEINPGKSVHVISQHTILFQGSDVGSILMRLYINNELDKMLSFTSAASIIKFGREFIRNHYKEEFLGFEMKIKSMTWNSDSTIATLSYECKIQATIVIKRMNVVWEADTPKVILTQEGRIFY